MKLSIDPLQFGYEGEGAHCSYSRIPNHIMCVCIRSVVTVGPSRDHLEFPLYACLGSPESRSRILEAYTKAENLLCVYTKCEAVTEARTEQ